MLRLRITDLLERHNREHRPETGLTIQDVATAIGVPRGTLAPLNSFNRAPVTNTAYVEALYRYFRRLLPGLLLDDLVEFDPPVDRTATIHVDELYPNRKRQQRVNANTHAQPARTRTRRVRR